MKARVIIIIIAELNIIPSVSSAGAGIKPMRISNYLRAILDSLVVL